MADHFRFEIATRGADDFELLHEGHVLLRYGSGGTMAMPGESATSRFRIADLARWGAPFALAASGVVFLHAATVARNGLIVSIMGEGGAGKSTLARSLTRLGWTLVSDDMVACDAGGNIGLLSEGVLRGWAAEMQAAWSTGQALRYSELARRLREQSGPWEPLRRVLFLGPRLRTQGTAQLRGLSSMQTFEHLTKLGFGNVPIRSAWAHQTKTHSALASTAEGATACVPEGLEALDSSMPELQEQLLRGLTAGAETG